MVSPAPRLNEFQDRIVRGAPRVTSVTAPVWVMLGPAPPPTCVPATSRTSCAEATAGTRAAAAKAHPARSRSLIRDPAPWPGVRSLRRPTDYPPPDVA